MTMRFQRLSITRRVAGLTLGLGLTLATHIAAAAQAKCDHIWKDNTSIIRLPSSVAVPYVQDVGTIFQNTVWQAPESAGLNDGNKAIMVCSTPGDIAFEFKADGNSPNEANAGLYPYFLPTDAPSVLIKVTYGKGSGQETIMTFPSSKGSAILNLPNAIPEINEKGEPLDGTAKPTGWLLIDGTPKTYTVTINKLKAITPMTATAELLKYANTGSTTSLGTSHRFTWYMKYAGATNAGQWSTVFSRFQFSPTQVTLAPCYPPEVPAMINLGNVPIKNFPTNGTRYNSPPVPFQISLNCPGMGSSGGVYFGFQPDLTYSGQLDLMTGESSPDNAAGVAIELLKADGVTRQPLLRQNDLNTNWLKSDISANKKNSTMSFFARIRQMENTVTPGSVSARATLLINFK